MTWDDTVIGPSHNEKSSAKLCLEFLNTFLCYDEKYDTAKCFQQGWMKTVLGGSNFFNTIENSKKECHFGRTPCSNRMRLDLGFGLIRIGQCWTDTLRKWSLRCRKHYIISSLINTISFYGALPLQWKWKNWNRLFTLYSTALRYYINLISKNPLENSLRKMKFMFLPFKFIIELTASTLHWETKFEKCHL